jgi:exonuclease III
VQAKKITATLKDECEVIFISDIRLNSDKNKYAVHDIEKKCYNRGYTILHNSKKSSRGVGILLKTSLNTTIINTIADNNDNYLLIKVTIKGKNLILGAIYGPNLNDLSFF